jgi:Planctomycete cytochrome C
VKDVTCIFWLGFEAPLVAGVAMDFVRDVRPILEEDCFDCHGAEKRKSGLRLDSTGGILRSGESGEPLFVKGSSGESYLVKKVTSKSAKEVMPPKGGRLTPEQGLIFSSSLSRLTVSSFAPPYSYRHRW